MKDCSGRQHKGTHDNSHIAFEINFYSNNFLPFLRFAATAGIFDIYHFFFYCDLTNFHLRRPLFLGQIVTFTIYNNGVIIPCRLFFTHGNYARKKTISRGAKESIHLHCQNGMTRKLKLRFITLFN